MVTYRFLKASILPALCAIVASCDKESSPPPGFDRGPLLENLGVNIIVPAYDTLARRAARLESAAVLFTETPSEENLENLREAWLSAYIAYQHCAYFNFGPADQLVFNTSVNTFPISKIKIDENISSGSYDLGAVSNNAAKGFAALDYLIYGINPDPAFVVELFDSDDEASARRQYLLDVVDDLSSRCDAISQQWSPAGEDYLGTFVSLLGNDVGSSTGMLLNGAIQYFERDVRDGKIGIPLGIRSLNVPIPGNCEALYAQKSILLATESIKALQKLYLGKGISEGIGFDDYLEALNARHNGDPLADVIAAQIDLALAKTTAIPEPYSETVETNPDPASAAYQELQKLVVLLKADMMSALGILITYQDNDGD
jgi:predicted lipoprotein